MVSVRLAARVGVSFEFNVMLKVRFRINFKVRVTIRS